MADYGNFPFAVMSTREIVSLMMESQAIGDGEFVEACRREIAKRPEGDTDTQPKTPQEVFQEQICAELENWLQRNIPTKTAELPKPQGLWRRGM